MKTHHRSHWRLEMTVAALLLAVTTTSVAQESWRLRVDFSWLNPSGSIVSTDYADKTAGVDFETGAGAGIRGEYQYSNRFGVELGVLGAGRLKAGFEIPGVADSKGVELGGFTALTLGLNFHLTPGHRIDLYAGPQLVLSRFSGVERLASIGHGGATTSTDDDLGWGVIFGLDLPLGGHGWLIQTNLRYIDTDLKSSGSDISFNKSFDPVIFSVGFGYRF